MSYETDHITERQSLIAIAQNLTKLVSLLADIKFELNLIRIAMGE